MKSVRNMFNAKTRMVMAGTVGVMAVGAVVLGGSTAEFSGSTTNEGNTWASGQVALVNDRATAAFTAENIEPGYLESQCITVTSTSSVPVDMKMYSANLVKVNGVAPSALSDQLQIDIQEGTGGTQANDINTNRGVCNDFVADTVVYTGGLSAFGTFANNYDQGAGQTSVDAGASKQYKITVSLPSTATSDVAGQSAGVDFVWEAKSKG